MKSKWVYYNLNEEKIREIETKYNINRLLATILVNREIEDIKQYLEKLWIMLLGQAIIFFWLQLI